MGRGMAKLSQIQIDGEGDLNQVKLPWSQLGTELKPSRCKLGQDGQRWRSNALTRCMMTRTLDSTSRHNAL
eukprot:12408218-Karenia_brevis.AAC.1